MGGGGMVNGNANCNDPSSVDEKAREEASKHQIIVYDKSLDEKEIDDLKQYHKNKCECEVDQLESVGAFVLTYDSANHKTIADLGLDDKKEVGEEDSVAQISGLMPR